jgi:transcription antitermination protein NusB
MRRRGRECALQILYQLDIGKELDGGAITDARLTEALAHFWASFEAVPDAEREFAERLVRGVVREVHALDEAIRKVSQNWRVDRMEKVDKSLLRLGAYEILRCPDIPRAASINEAIEIAKRFSGKESAAFVNGVLDQLAKSEADDDDGARGRSKDAGFDPD